MPLLKRVIERYSNKKIYVETGSYQGESIKTALECGFNAVYSIELSKELFEHCVNRFEADMRVHMIYGDSAFALAELLAGKEINEPAVFFLDAHGSGGITVDSPDVPYGKVLEMELNAIKNHKTHGHTILIDDMRGYDKNYFEESISQLFPDYLISYEDGFVPGDVLVAYPKNEKIALKGSNWLERLKRFIGI